MRLPKIVNLTEIVQAKSLVLNSNIYEKLFFCAYGNAPSTSKMLKLTMQQLKKEHISESLTELLGIFNILFQPVILTDMVNRLLPSWRDRLLLLPQVVACLQHWPRR